MLLHHTPNISTKFSKVFILVLLLKKQMKRGFVYLVLLILAFMPSVMAEINIEPLMRTSYNIGDDIYINGEILLDKTTQADLNIEIMCNDQTIPVYFSLVNINANEVKEFSENVPVLETMLGECYFWVKLSDKTGTNLEDSSEKLTASKKLDVDISSTSLHQFPGSVITISGSVKLLSGANVKKARVTITLDDKTFITSIENGAFSYDLLLPNNIKSGAHNLNVYVEDGFGNNGEASLVVYAKTIAKELVVNLEKSTFKPGEEIIPDIMIYDQGGELISKPIRLELTNPNNEIEYSETGSTSIKTVIKLSRFAMPGTWGMSIESGELKAQKQFYVEEVIDKEIIIKEDVLYITNIGNVDYTSPIEIDLEGEEDYTITKKTSLKPNQTITIDLTKEVPKGEYDINIEGYPAITGNVILEKGKFTYPSSNKIVSYSALIFVLVFLMYTVFSRKVIRKQKRRELARIEGKRKLEELRGKKIRGELKPKYSNMYKSKKEDVDYLIKKVQTEEDKKDESSGNLFNIFD